MGWRASSPSTWATRARDRGRNGGNSRDGRSTKRVNTDAGEVKIEVPRDREGTLEPQLVAKGQRRLPGFDEKVFALYARA